MSQLYPILTDLKERKVVAVGGGNVAQRKVQSLLECQAQVTVISPEVTKPLQELARAGDIRLLQRPYQGGDLEGAWLVIAATGDEKVNRQVFREANEKHIFCNVVDVPELCSFQVPAVVNRGDLQIAVSTGGASPALAKQIRKELQQEYGEHYEIFLKGLRDLREHFKNKYPDDQPRRAKLLEGFVNSEVLELLRQGKNNEFQLLLDEWKQR